MDIEDENMSSDSSSECNENISEKINKLTNQARSNLIPENSKRLYEAQYIKFTQWRAEMKVKTTDETILLAYFQFLSEKYKATTLWATYSKLKSMLIFKEKVDIGKFLELQCFLKRKQKKHEVKKSKVFTNEEIFKFLNSAPDEEFLLHKVVLIFGLHGCLRKKELLDLKTHEVKQHGAVFHVLISETKTGVSKSFYTSEEFYSIIDKYVKLRPEGMERFFVQYRNKKCTHQNIGKGKLGNIPKDIAKFLNLHDIDNYTGHAFRRTSATIIADQGADLMTLKRHGVWKSSTVAESYVNESSKNKKNISKLISSAINLNNKKVPVSSKINHHAASTSFQSDNIENITQKEFEEVISSEFLPCLENSRSENIIENNKKQPLQDFDITQEELEEIVSTQFSPPLQNLKSKDKVQNETQQPLEDFDITQEELQEVVSTQFSPILQKSKLKRQNNKQLNEDVSNIARELQEATTDFLGNKIQQNKPFYIFKNCNITVNRK